MCPVKYGVALARAAQKSVQRGYDVSLNHKFEHRCCGVLAAKSPANEHKPASHHDIRLTGNPTACSSKLDVKVVGHASIDTAVDCSSSSTGDAPDASCASSKLPFEITVRSPLVVSPGTMVTLTGHGFIAGMKLFGFPQSVDLLVTSDTQASFVIPQDADFGTLNLSVERDGAVQKVDLFFYAWQE